MGFITNKSITRIKRKKVYLLYQKSYNEISNDEIILGAFTSSGKVKKYLNDYTSLYMRKIADEPCGGIFKDKYESLLDTEYSFMIVGYELNTKVKELSYIEYIHTSE